MSQTIRDEQREDQYKEKHPAYSYCR